MGEFNIRDYDEYYELLSDAAEIIMKANDVSTSLLQRRLRLGYNRAHRIMQMLEDNGIVNERERAILIKQGELAAILNNLKPIEQRGKKLFE